MNPGKPCRIDRWSSLSVRHCCGQGQLFLQGFTQVAAAGIEAQKCESNRNSRKKASVSQSCFELGLGRHDCSAGCGRKVLESLSVLWGISGGVCAGHCYCLTQPMLTWHSQKGRQVLENLTASEQWAQGRFRPWQSCLQYPAAKPLEVTGGDGRKEKGSSVCLQSEVLSEASTDSCHTVLGYFYSKSTVWKG